MLKFIAFLFTTITIISISHVKGATIEKPNPEYNLTLGSTIMISKERDGKVVSELIIGNKTINADDNYTMFLINGTLVDNTNIVYINYDNDRVLVPIRVISESINSKVDWDGKARKVVITKNNNKIELIIDNKEATVNKKKVALDVAPKIINNYTYLPIGFISENMNCTVEYVNTQEKGFDEFLHNDFPFFFRTIVVEEKSTEKYLTVNEALESLKTKLNSYSKDYLKRFETYNGKEVTEMYSKVLETEIPQLELKREIGRYYLFTRYKVGTYLVDKYTGEMFIFENLFIGRDIKSIETYYPYVFEGIVG